MTSFMEEDVISLNIDYAHSFDTKGRDDSVFLELVPWLCDINRKWAWEKSAWVSMGGALAEREKSSWFIESD